MAALLVLDFDGTMTDAEEEGRPFRGGYLEDTATLLGRSLDEVLALAERFEAEVAADPQAHGWVYGGEIVAPASVDPYLRVMPVVRKIFDTFEAFANEGERNRLLDGILYKYNYLKTLTAFRDGAREALVALEGTDTYVVTNSHTDAVANKILTLGETPGGENALGWLVERVHGLARKYVVDDAFDLVPRDLSLPGLARPVKLRRKSYFDVLEALRAKVGAEWAEVAVCGDIFELDLALPLAMGARVGLVANAFTPEYERAFVQAHPLGRVVESLAELVDFVR